MQRPLSPHLQVYRPQITSVMSILHRLTGVAVAAGLILVSMLFIAAPYGADTWSAIAGILFSFLGSLLLILLAAGVFYHLCNGIRHLFWDSTRGLEMNTIRSSAMVVIGVAAVLTLLTVVFAG